MNAAVSAAPAAAVEPAPAPPRRAPRGPARPAAAAVGVVMVAFLALLAARLGAPDPADADPLAGRLAPSLTGRTLTGDAFDLDTLRGRWVVVNFWASWCPPCWREHPELVEFERRHQAAGDARVVGVVFNDDPAAARAFMAERGGGWPVVLDEDGSRSVAYAVTKAPETILVAPSGVVVAKHKGEVSADLLDRLIADVSRRAEAGS